MNSYILCLSFSLLSLATQSLYSPIPFPHPLPPCPFTPGHERCGEGSGAHGTVRWCSGLLHQGGLPGHGGRRGQHCGGQLVLRLRHHPQGVLHVRPSSSPPSASMCAHPISYLHPVLLPPLHVTTTTEVCPYLLPHYSSFHFSSAIFCGSRQKIPLFYCHEHKIGEMAWCKGLPSGTPQPCV